jgi:UDP-N-acetylglucosamine--N-acetylmuramyl-(pentapeptide) pyrophosphoryl-undecaprenol N-acetylglucosamine transferase
MKIVLTGGGSGGHFYPLIAVAQEINTIAAERNLVQPELHYLANTPYDEELLYENDIQYHHVSAGKIRKYVSLKNGTDFFKTLIGLPTAIAILFRIFPDVVFSKGGYVSVPVVLAARILRIPVFVHESDAVPGRANLFAGKFAARVAVSYPEAGEQFTKHKEGVAFTGNPIRKEVREVAVHGAHEYLQLDTNVPTLVILGGSQGAEAINDVILQALPELLNKYQVIHQIGTSNFDAYKTVVDVAIENHPNRNRYKPFATLNSLALRMAGGVAALIISRAGSGSIFEIANWDKPSILIPIPEHVSRDQRHNAFAYARTGATDVIEQNNLTPHVLVAEIERILGDEELQQKMKAGAQSFKKPDAAHKIAVEIIRMALEHELE